MTASKPMPEFIQGARLAALYLREEVNGRLFDIPGTWAEEYVGKYHNWIRTQLKFGAIARAEMAIGFDQFYADTSRNRWILELTERTLSERNTVRSGGRKRILPYVRHFDFSEIDGVKLRLLENGDPKKVEWVIESDYRNPRDVTPEYVANLARVLFPFVARKLDATAFHRS